MKRVSRLMGFLFLFLPFLSKGQETGQTPIRIISYNIWNGFEKPERREAFIQWMNLQKPEIVALEELVGFTEKDLAELAAAYGHPYVTIVKEEGYPVGLTSKQPIQTISKQVEGFWHGMLHARTYDMDFIVVHLSPFEWKYRLKEAKKITDYIEKNELESCVVLGDFNAFSPFDAAEIEMHIDLKSGMQNWDKEQEVYRNMRGEEFDYSVLSEFLSKGFSDPCQQFIPVAKRMSYPTATLYNWAWGDVRLPRKSQRIDYILLSPTLTPYCKQATVHNGPDTDTISDHYPVSIVLY